MGRGLGTAETNLVAGFSWQSSHGRVLMAIAPSGEGGRLAAKPQTGRGLGTAETNLVAAFSWQGSHGPGGGNFKQLSHSSIV